MHSPLVLTLLFPLRTVGFDNSFFLRFLRLFSCKHSWAFLAIRMIPGFLTFAFFTIRLLHTAGRRLCAGR
jgi:hypothetical protein